VGRTEAVGKGLVAVDTALFVYLIEEHPRFLAPVRALFARADRGEIEIVTSALTLLEVLVVPLRTNDQRLAARLRAQHGALRTPDALQLAAAISTGCESFVTNERRMPAPDGLRVLQLSEFA